MTNKPDIKKLLNHSIAEQTTQNEAQKQLKKTINQQSYSLPFITANVLEFHNNNSEANNSLEIIKTRKELKTPPPKLTKNH